MKIRTRDGAELHVRIDGTETGRHLPIVLSNSLGTNLHLWDSLAGKLAPSRRIVRYDKRGHGLSDVVPGPYATDMLSMDVIDIMDAAEIERADFCGLSIGGMSGQWLAAHRPARFRRVVIANTVAHMQMNDIWDDRIAAVNSGGMAAVADAVLDRWFTPAFRQSHPDEVKAVRAMLLATDPAGYAACCAAVRDLDVRAEAADITCPVLVIAGSHDLATPAEQGRAIANAIAGAEYLLLDAAHLSSIERPAEFENAVTGFLDR